MAKKGRWDKRAKLLGKVTLFVTTGHDEALLSPADINFLSGYGVV